MSIFSFVGLPKLSRSGFNLTHERKFSLNMGDLIPMCCEEIYPGDSFSWGTEVFLRFSPLMAPIMHRVNVYTHFFFVPNRLVWDNWQSFITGGEHGDDNSVLPYTMLNNGGGVGTLADYLGVQCSENADYQIGLMVNALPFRAYDLIWNEYYRDQDLQTPLDISKSDGLDPIYSDVHDWPIRKRAWEKDYFTSARPDVQKGPAVTVPLTGDAPVYRVQTDGDRDFKFASGSGFSTGGDKNVVANLPNLSLMNLQAKASDSSEWAKIAVNADNLRADMSQVSGVDINDLRATVQLKRWMERNMRAGSRYVESIWAHFRARVPDSRLQRPEFLGGGKSPVTVSEVLQTSSSDTASPQANMAGHGISVAGNHAFKHRFNEHGYVIGLISVIPRTSYQQGVRRMFRRESRFDFYFPEFAHLGEQAILNSEVFTGDGNYVNGVFGYTGRYNELRYIPSSVHGDLRTSLNMWHAGRIFAGQPGLGSAFIQSNEVPRIFAVNPVTTGYDSLYCQVLHKVKAVRNMPKIADPGYMDHF